MVTNKKRFREWISFLLLAAVVAWFTGCTPAGPRALLRGKRLMEEGKYADAVEELKVATSLLPTNALAWNYLGLAYHHSGQAASAADAYQRSLRLNHDLVVVHYDLGCLLLEQNRPDTLVDARDQLTAYVLHQGNSTDGWLKLGTAQLRLAELTQAEASFKEVLKLNAQNAEAMNDLGVIQLQRRRNRDAAAYFNAALKLQPNYAPALLNFAVTEGYLNNHSLALQKYQEYLALNPRPANWEAVNAIAQQLEQQLNPPTIFPSNAVVAVNPVTNNQNHPTTAPTNVPKPETVVSVTHPIPPPVVRPQSNTEPVVKPEVVRVPDSPTIKVASQSNTTMPVASSSITTSDPQIIGDTNDIPDTSTDQKRGFFQHLNPMGLFHRKTKPPAKPTPLSPVVTPQDATENPIMASTDTNSSPKPQVRTVSVPRYPYLSPVKPPSGNRNESERLLAQGEQAQRDHRFKEAISLYRASTQADPSYFEAQSSLGLAAFDYGDLPESLRAYEMALAINPDSFSARYNFGLALKRANYIKDAAQELERLLASNSAGESPAHLAMVHLTLANLYAEQFHQTAPARAHYLKVLELDPHNSQATSIRYWLQDNG